VAIKKLHNEAALLRRISTGDERAFAELFRGYYNQLGEFVQLITRDLEATAEIVQEIFTKVWINRESLPLVKKFDAYLFILCRNHTLNHIRRQVAEREKQRAFLNDTVLMEPALKDVEEAKDYHALVEKALQSLPPRQQQVFVLRLQGLKNPEISRQMNLSLESVKKYQHLAMKSIKEFMQVETLVSLAFLLFF